MRKTILILCALTLLPITARAQGDQAASTSQAQQERAKQEIAKQERQKAEEESAKQQQRMGIVRSYTNVQVELTITDQLGTGAPEKKTVSMIVMSGSWSKIRNTAARTGPFQVGLNVDARPFLNAEGGIQLELTIYYYPPQGKPDQPVLPTELNQSLSVLLQSGKPMVVSQAADPASDRKVTVEVKATILK